MAKSTTHTQCEMQRGTTKETAWIPTDKAVIGKTTRLKDENGEWTDGWVVLSKGMTMDSQMVIDRQRDWTNQRAASDI